ncbi:radical SAM protein [candidate division KSB1 bacterium]|nr:radical SAM protein [candidate division KSB1 bacterium]
MLTFGPVPSRRLGKSLGINNIPYKSCTYSCVYCQLGRSEKMNAERRPFYDPRQIYQSVAEKIDLSERAGESMDYLTFVPDGEPTLDVNLEEEIDLIRAFNAKIAVITNSSLIHFDPVKAALYKSDWVSVKVDTVIQQLWRKINRPHRSLDLETILESIIDFRRHYRGTLVTETMLVRDLNDHENDIEKLLDYLKVVLPDVAYLSIPTRPPAEKWVQAPAEESLIRAHQILSSKLKSVEFLIGYEGNAFAVTGDVKKDLLSITAVHPMREEAVAAFLKRAGSDWSVVDKLLQQNLIVKKEFQGKNFYARKLFFPRNRESNNRLE